MNRPDPAQWYAGKRVLITGGLGFIGSNLARAVVAMEARGLVVDSLIPEYGGLLYNVAGVEDRLTINISDVRDEHSLRFLVRDQDVLFNLAGQTSHLDSMTDPYTDLEINCRSAAVDPGGLPSRRTPTCGSSSRARARSTGGR